MLLKYFYDEALAHASYMIGCQKTGEAILIDPDRNVEHYLQAARKQGMAIVGTAETHIHADYVSGSRELAEKTGARIYVSDEGPMDWKYTFVEAYNHQLLKDGDEFSVGNIKFQVMHTPGHTPESISFIVTDVGGGAIEPMGIFTGDFVFVGSLGRPDLLEEAAGQMGTAEPGARDLFRSVQRFRTLPDHLQVWPSHGAGSACGKGLGAIPSSTVGYEKLFNEGFQFQSEDEFVKYILKDQPEAPPYFAIMKHVNKHGPKIIGQETRYPKMEIVDLANAINNHQVLDVRAAKSFAHQHVPGSINVPTKLIAREGSWFINYSKPLYLITGSDGLDEAARVLLEIGVDNVEGYFDIEEILTANLANESYDIKTPEELFEPIKNQDVHLVDVRRRAEWNEGHIQQATYSFLGKLQKNMDSLGDDRPVVFQCRTGTRSAIACSIAQAAGIKNVINLKSGIEGWNRLDYPIVMNEPQTIG